MSRFLGEQLSLIFHHPITLLTHTSVLVFILCDCESSQHSASMVITISCMAIDHLPYTPLSVVSVHSLLDFNILLLALLVLLQHLINLWGVMRNLY